MATAASYDDGESNMCEELTDQNPSNTGLPSATVDNDLHCVPKMPHRKQKRSSHKASHKPETTEVKMDTEEFDPTWEADGMRELEELIKKTWPKGIEAYSKQREELWPSSGRHILASHDDHSIIVYQAFCPAIAEAAVRDQRFGGGGFSFTRMSWIKTNFLWMMYRCGWATKHNQERVLAVRITLDGFHQILAAALTTELQKGKGLNHCEVRLQWDPDHSPTGENQKRRAIQLGLKDDILKNYSSKWIVSITDVTPFVRFQHRVLKVKGQRHVRTPLEHVYNPPSLSICQRIQLDCHVSSKPQLVS